MLLLVLSQNVLGAIVAIQKDLIDLLVDGLAGLGTQVAHFHQGRIVVFCCVVAEANLECLRMIYGEKLVHY